MDDKAKAKKIWNQTSWLERILCLVLIVYFVYLNQSTSLVLNINDGNSSRVINGVKNEPNTVLYLPNDYVPKSGVSNTQMWIGMGITVVLIFVLLSRKTLLGRATIHEALEDIATQIIQIKHLKGASINATKEGITIKTDVDEIELSHHFLTRYRFIGNNNEAFNYVISVKIKDAEGSEYFKAHYNPLTRYWDGFVRSSVELVEKDQCPVCGNEYNERQILGADLAALKAGKEMLGMRIR